MKRRIGKHDKAHTAPVVESAETGSETPAPKPEKTKRVLGKHGKTDLPELEPLHKELKREKYKRRFRRILRSTVSVLVVVAAVAALIATLVLPVLQIAGTSMEPSLSDGDIVVLAKTGKLETGDLCAFYYSNKVLIKRVIAGPGQYLWIDDDGTVHVDGQVLDEPYIEKKALGECDIEMPYQVPENHYFVMGDQRETSIDSRSSVIGSIDQEQIIRKLLCKVWPLDEMDWLG